MCDNMEKRVESCTTCYFKEGIRCHRYPPSLISRGSALNYPIVDDNGWCGEWKPKK